MDWFKGNWWFFTMPATRKDLARFWVEVDNINRGLWALADAMKLPNDTDPAIIMAEARDRVLGRNGWVRAYKRKKAAK